MTWDQFVLEGLHLDQTPLVKTLVSEATTNDLVREFLKCRAINDPRVEPALRTYLQAELLPFLDTRPTPDQVMSWQREHPAPGKSVVVVPSVVPLLPAATIDAGVARLATTSADAILKTGDTEFGSDDWSRVNVSYRLTVSSDGRSVDAVVTWDAMEGNRKQQYPKDTWFQSKKVFRGIYTLARDEPRNIASVNGADASSSENYRGECHGLKPFPAFGAMSDIQVAFDQNGRQDQNAQQLRASIALSINLAPQTQR